MSLHRAKLRLAAALVGWLLVALARANCADAQMLSWSKLAPIPDAEGFACPLAGVHNGALIVGGGANFPKLKPWEGGAKVWYDTVYVLTAPDGRWQTAGKLPRPLAYGVSITTARGVVCIGGSDAKRHYADCFLLGYENGQLKTSPLKSLPRPCANFCGAMLGQTIYVAGGIEKPDDTTAMKSFWSLDWTRPDAGWTERQPWPGPERLLATAGTQGDSFYLFGGAGLERGADGKALRRFLHDAYCYTPLRGWRRIADLPRAAVAAPTPAPQVGMSHLLVLGGDDGAQAASPMNEHRGFSRDLLRYDTSTDAWSRGGEVPFSLVTTPTVRWQNRVIVPGGEARPGIRSTEVWSGSPQEPGVR
jgi:N-acetylneuraminic acid mutarotase